MVPFDFDVHRRAGTDGDFNSGRWAGLLRHCRLHEERAHRIGGGAAELDSPSIVRLESPFPLAVVERARRPRDRNDDRHTRSGIALGSPHEEGHTVHLVPG